MLRMKECKGSWCGRKCKTVKAQPGKDSNPYALSPGIARDMLSLLLIWTWPSAVPDLRASNQRVDGLSQTRGQRFIPCATKVAGMRASFAQEQFTKKKRNYLSYDKADDWNIL